ncbi:MAG: S8 family serine peptidase [Betaproteobacteria bacterium]
MSGFARRGLTAAAFSVALLNSIGAFSKEPPPVDQIIVKFAVADDRVGTASAREEAVSKEVGLRAKRLRVTGGGAQVFKLERAVPHSDAKRAADRIAKQPGVLWAEPDAIMVPMQTQIPPNDPQFAGQWNLTDAVGGINVDTIWQKNTGRSITVAVVDTGIATATTTAGAVVTPPDLALGRLLPSFDMITDSQTARDGNARDNNPRDEGDWRAAGDCPAPSDTAASSSWHGTKVASIVAATANNSLAIVGVAPDANVLPVRALGRCGGTSSDIADAIRWAAGLSLDSSLNLAINPNPARVINLSLGNTGACSNTFAEAINAAIAAGSVVVAAAGNGQRDTTTGALLGVDIDAAATTVQPASCPGVIAVAATTRNGQRASYSNFGRNTVALAAPGGEVGSVGTERFWVITNAGQQGPTTDFLLTRGTVGTSLSAPHVSGVVALMLASNPTLTPAEVRNRLIASARPFPTGSTCASVCGAGIVDATAAVNFVDDDDIDLSWLPAILPKP